MKKKHKQAVYACNKSNITTIMEEPTVANRGYYWLTVAILGVMKCSCYGWEVLIGLDERSTGVLDWKIIVVQTATNGEMKHENGAF
jgi:hypothetical protein